MKQNYPFDPDVRHHLIIALLSSLWIFVFLFFTEPFDVNQLNYDEKFEYLSVYSLIGGLCYVAFLPLQYAIYRRFKNKWTAISELVFLSLFVIISISFARLFYRYVVVANEPNPYSLLYMLKRIFIPAVATILPVIIIARFAFGKYFEKQLDNKKIEIKGVGNYEGLRLQLNEVICIQSSDNYIEVFYLSGKTLKKTLIRNKLTEIDKQFPELLRTHRSFLINPYHFQQWKTNNSKLFVLLSYDIEVPVSKTYQKLVKTVIHSATN